MTYCLLEFFNFNSSPAFQSVYLPPVLATLLILGALIYNAVMKRNVNHLPGSTVKSAIKLSLTLFVSLMLMLVIYVLLTR